MPSRMNWFRDYSPAPGADLVSRPAKADKPGAGFDPHNTRKETE